MTPPWNRMIQFVDLLRSNDIKPPSEAKSPGGDSFPKLRKPPGMYIHWFATGLRQVLKPRLDSSAAIVSFAMQSIIN